jgi:signal transduction histidine kinase
VTQAVNRLAAPSGTAIEVAVDPLLSSVPAAVEVAVYRIACEAVTNVVKHAEASHCHVAISIVGRSLILRVTDSGHRIGAHACGPDDHLAAAHAASIGASPAGGHGLATMRERAEELGGALDIVASDSGTAVTVTLPLPLPLPLPDTVTEAVAATQPVATAETMADTAAHGDPAATAVVLAEGVG